MKKHFPSVVFLIIITVISFHPTIHNGWTSWDDNVYVTDNPYIRGFSFANIAAMWSTHFNGSYLPLTMMTYMSDFTIGGYDPTVYHAVNLLYHLVNVLLVFQFIAMLTGGNAIASLVVAAIFAIHPMHVESVAWISGRKDVVSTLFVLLSMIAYLMYLGQKTSVRFYIALICFLCALLSKVSVIVLPLLLILIDSYVGRQSTINTYKEKLPFVFFAVVFALIGIISQFDADAVRKSSLVDIFVVPHYALIFYMIKFIFPYELSAVYPYPKMVNVYFAPEVYIAIPVVYALIYCIWKYRKNGHIIFGALFFLVVMLPVIQIVRFSNIIAADRFTYLSYIGLSLPIGIWVSDVYMKYSRTGKKALILIGCIVCIALTGMTMDRTRVWKDSETVWKDVLSKYPNALH